MNPELGERPPAPAGTQAIQRALTLLELLQAGPVSLSALARRAGLARPTTHRLLAALEGWRLVERRGSDYAAGPGLQEQAALAALTRPGSWPRRSPLLERAAAGNQSASWRDWSGQLHAATWEPTHDLEYWAIRNAAALIDVSALYKYEIRGPQAADAMQRLFTRDLSKCRVGQVLYGCWCNDDGYVLQDGNLWRIDEQRFRLTAADPTVRWLRDVAAPFDCEIVEVTDQLASVALQGPRARQVLVSFLASALGDTKAAQRAVTQLRHFRGVEVEGPFGTLGVTRTGFTGDLGYELWIPAEAALATWDRLLEVGESVPVRPAGLVALDATRIEAGLVLIEVDFVSAAHALTARRLSTPYDLGLGWAVALNEGNDFVGRRALEQQLAEAPPDWLLCGVRVPWSELDDAHRRFGLRPVSVGQEPCRQVQPLWSGDRQVGQLTSQVFSPLVKAQIGIASVRASALGIDATAGADAWGGTPVEIDIDIEMERVRVRAELVPLPFYDPPHKRSRVKWSAGEFGEAAS